MLRRRKSKFQRRIISPDSVNEVLNTVYRVAIWSELQRGEEQSDFSTKAEDYCMQFVDQQTSWYFVKGYCYC